jgi:hypothetical protein
MLMIEDRWCIRCHAQTPSQLYATNHLRHFLLTLLLCGFWIPVWIRSSTHRAYHCMKCGKFTYSLLDKVLLGAPMVLGFVISLSIVLSKLGAFDGRVLRRPSTPSVVTSPAPTSESLVDVQPARPLAAPRLSILPATVVPPLTSAVPSAGNSVAPAGPESQEVVDPKLQEIEAAILLSGAKIIYQRSPERAEPRLREIIEKYPDTDAALEAEALLE